MISEFLQNKIYLLCFIYYLFLLKYLILYGINHDQGHINKNHNLSSHMFYNSYNFVIKNKKHIKGSTKCHIRPNPLLLKSWTINKNPLQNYLEIYKIYVFPIKQIMLRIIINWRLFLIVLYLIADYKRTIS